MICELALIAVMFFFGNIESIKTRMNYRSGDFMIGVLLPVTKGNNCGIVNHRSVQMVEAIIYGVEKININQNLFNLTIGYEIRDTCSNPTAALKEATYLLSGEPNNSACVGKTQKCQSKVIVVLGPEILENILLTAGSLNLHHFPQIIYRGKTRLLSNTAMYSHLNSITPSLSDTAEAITLLIASLGWTSVNVIGSDDVYGREMTALLDQNLRSKNICISTQRLISTSDSTVPAQIHETVSRIRSNNQVRVTVLVTEPNTARRILHEARSRNLTAHVWIGSEVWMSDLRIVEEYRSTLEGMLGTAYSANSWPSLPGLKRQQLQRTRYSDWLRALYPSKTILDDGTNSKLINLEEFSPDRMNNVLKAIDAIAHALEYITKQRQGNTRIENNITRVRNEVTRILSIIIAKEVEKRQLKIVNLQRQLPGKLTYQQVGSWTKNQSQEGKMFLDKENIRWPGSYKLWVPFSGYVEPCSPGTYVKKGPMSCIWECLSCPKGMYTDNFTSTSCKRCPEGKMPNKMQTGCIVPDQEYLKAMDPFGICILSACTVGIIITGAVLAIFLKYQSTPVVKASNMGFCLFTLVLLLLWFLSPVLFLGRPRDWICKLRTVCIPLLYTSVSALLLTKTKRLIRIFSALKRNRFLSNYWYSFVACSIVLVQIVFCAIYLVFFPPETLMIYERARKIYLHCTRNIALEIASFSYNCLLAVLCASFAVKSRNLPETYSEAKHICFTMLTYMVSWIIYFFGYYGIIYGNLKAAIPSFGVIIGAFAVLFFIFIPKIRVIFFRPEKNTKMAAFAGTRKYSHDVACGMNITIPKPSRACERRHTLATLPAYHETALSFSPDPNNQGKDPRLSGSCLVGPIKEVDMEEESAHAHEEMNGSTNIVLKKDVNLNINSPNEVTNGYGVRNK